MPFSHHSHSGQFCKHASGMLEDVVLSAIGRGFLLYGLTEHVPRYRASDLYPEEADMSLTSLTKQFQDFVNEAHRLKAAYSQQINLLVGLETEYITTLDLDHLDNLLQACENQIQFLVGSIHHVNGIPIDFDIDTYHRAVNSLGKANREQAQEEFIVSYLDAQYEILRRFHPEIIGHIDLCRLYTPELRFSDYPRAHEKLVRNIQFATGYGALFEVNSAALRKRWDTPYPGKDVIELIYQEGGHLTISDDSHSPHDVGVNYDRVRHYLESVGIKELWYLKESTTRNAGGRMVIPEKLPGDWWTHPFWTQPL
ncbi:polymerase/histidinol phosphatase-like protein [Amanita muscaria]